VLLLVPDGLELPVVLLPLEPDADAEALLPLADAELPLVEDVLLPKVAPLELAPEAAAAVEEFRPGVSAVAPPEG